MRVSVICRAAVVALCLAGCTVEPATQAVLDAYRLSQGGGSAPHRLDPALQYLRVVAAGQENLLVLGYVDPAANGPVQVWYSGDGSVLRLDDGRLVGAAIRGVVDWSGVTFVNLPAWHSIGERAEFVRIRDVSPGYRYGIRDEMHIRRIPAPDDSGLAGIAPALLTWFEESVAGGAGDGQPARYAVEHAGTPAARVVYGEQCLTAQYCLSWQNWPVSGGEGR
ncbi:MAG: YjbF family lipoprotein [Gallionella sp.]|nr:YjbF family lipoprotein [Gallionella sp.]MCK9352683.1 YjbF family lipoprotein [Gallionella sp.]